MRIPTAWPGQGSRAHPWSGCLPFFGHSQRSRARARCSRYEERTMRGFLVACVAAVLAAVAGWWLNEAVSGLRGISRASVERDLAQTKQVLSQEREKSKQADRQLAGALRQVASQASSLGDTAAQKQELTD